MAGFGALPSPDWEKLRELAEVGLRNPQHTREYSRRIHELRHGFTWPAPICNNQHTKGEVRE